VHTALWWLPPLAVAALVWRLQHASARRAAGLGLVFGTSWLLAAVWWLFISMHRYGGLPAWLAALAVVLLALALALYLALACALWVRLRSGRPGLDALAFAACWLLAEWARAFIFTGFPWAASGYTQIDGPLAAWAPWVGVYGLGALMALAGALLGLSGARAPRPRWRAASLWVAAAAVFAAPALTGTVEFTRSAGMQTVTLLQTAVPQDEKFSGDRLPETLAWLADALAQARGALVVAPETAVPLLPEQLATLAPGWWEGVVQRFAGSAQVGLLGLPLGSFEAGYTNSAVGLSAATSARQPGPYRYDKVHLVPFGEFIPTGFRWFTELMNIPLGDFTRGVLDPPSFAAAGQRIGPNICYEDLFGEELARRFVDPALAPTVLANISNIGWFGDTVAIPQHLAISRFRTLELQRPMLRATNTGATAAIDHRGVVTAQLPPHTQGVLQARVQGREGLTPFAWWAAHWGLWPLVALAALLLAVVRLAPRHA
jgi:apolipoprotein N-acyltransferase